MKSVDPLIYDADYYLADGYQGREEVLLRTLDNYEYLYDYPIKLADIKENESVLDVGCGMGRLAYKALKKNCIVTGIDYSKDAIAIANRIKGFLSEEEQKRITFINDDVLNISGGRKYDVVFMTDVIEHLYDWQLKILFSKLERSLNGRNGRIIIHTAPNRLNIRYLYPLKRSLSFISTIRKKKGIFYKRSKYFYDPAMHVNEQTVWSLKRYLANYESKIWCEDFSKNALSVIASRIMGNYIWAIAKLKDTPKNSPGDTPRD